MIKVQLDYSKITIGEIEEFKNSTFECDGDKKKIIVMIGDKK